MDSEKRIETLWAEWQCICCRPPRQIYIRYIGNLTEIYHEDDNSSAVRG